MGCEGSVLYCLYGGSGADWRVQAVPVSAHSFESRKKLPSAWCGLRDEALSALVRPAQFTDRHDHAGVILIVTTILQVGVDGAVFVHASGFIGGHKTKEGCLRMAVQ
eukprot:gene4657-5913_t